MTDYTSVGDSHIIEVVDEDGNVTFIEISDEDQEAEEETDGLSENLPSGTALPQGEGLPRQPSTATGQRSLRQ